MGGGSERWARAGEGAGKGEGNRGQEGRESGRPSAPRANGSSPRGVWLAGKERARKGADELEKRGRAEDKSPQGLRGQAGGGGGSSGGFEPGGLAISEGEEIKR